MRLALPKALLTAEQQGSPAQLQMAHIQLAIDEVQTAQRQVATHTNHATKDAKRAKALLGID